MKKNVYRERIYNNYHQFPNTLLTPVTVATLEQRGPYLRRLIKEHFPKDRRASILDLGCGYGAILHFAREAGYSNIVGIDGSMQQVATAHELGIEGVMQGDLLNALALTDSASQSCVITFDVIEHLTREELIPLVDEVFRVLQPQGHWIIHTPNGGSPFFARTLYGDLTHEFAFTGTSLAQLLFASGFQKIDCFEDAPVPHGGISAVRWILWQIIRFALRFYIAVETGETSGKQVFSQNFLTVAIK